MACSEAGPCAIGKTWDGTPTGTWVDDYGGTGLAAYVAKPPAGTPPATAAVLQVSDIYGATLKNAQLYADALARAAGVTVVLPDFFHVPGAGAWAPGAMDPSKFQGWLANYPRDRVLAEARAVVAAIKAGTGAATVDAVGFCWGGLYAALLAGGATPDVGAAVLLHPSLMKEADVEAITAPTLIIVNGDDAQVPDAFRAKIEETLKSKPASELHYYPGERHGFTLRADPTDASADAFKRTTAWIKDH